MGPIVAETQSQCGLTAGFFAMRSLHYYIKAAHVEGLTGSSTVVEKIIDIVKHRPRGPN